MIKKSYQQGFGLVELMVALVIGLIIILGAGQLFLTVFQTNRQVETLSEKQAAVNFAVDSLLRDIRRADDVDWDSGNLTLTVSNRGDIAIGSCAVGVEMTKVYRLSDAAVSDRVGRALEVGQNCSLTAPTDNFQEIVTAFNDDDNAFGATPSGTSGAVWVITLELMATDDKNGSPDPLVFNAVNRTAAVIN